MRLTTKKDKLIYEILLRASEYASLEMESTYRHAKNFPLEKIHEAEDNALDALNSLEKYLRQML